MSEKSTADLLDTIVGSLGSMPVRAMEEVIRRGEEAGPPTVALLDDLLEAAASGERPLEPIWLVILLGELRWTRAIPSLLAVLDTSAPGFIGLPSVTADALARMGAGAVDGLVARLDNAPPHRRLWVYSALRGMDDDPHARSRLRAAVRGDQELAAVVAAADEDDGRAPGPDFRLRYRPVPWLGIPEPGWAGWAVLERVAGRPLGRSRLPGYPFPRVLPEPPPTCARCGGPVSRALRTLVCPCTAVFMPAYLHRSLADAEERDGFRDVFAVLEAVERAARRLVLRPEPHGKQALADWRERLTELCDLWQGCVWLIEQGAEDVPGARERLLDELYLAAGIHGDPNRLVAWSEHGPSRRPPVWRRPSPVRPRRRKA
ncbi:MAG: hypothetical protein R6U63_01760 [Longimicrobiales bacterium]